MLVPPARLERTTPRLGIWCSIHLSYGGNWWKLYKACPLVSTKIAGIRQSPFFNLTTKWPLTKWIGEVSTPLIKIAQREEPKPLGSAFSIYHTQPDFELIYGYLLEAFSNRPTVKVGCPYMFSRCWDPQIFPQLSSPLFDDLSKPP